MAIIDTLLPEYDREMGTTRRLLERVPEAAFGFKPHERSMTLGNLTVHVAHLPTWVPNVMIFDSFDLASNPNTDTPQPHSALLAKATDGELAEPWTLKKGSQDLFTLPKLTMLRYFVLNHLIHHRGQLSVYLRLQDVPIPAIYGPSADEGAF